MMPVADIALPARILAGPGVRSQLPGLVRAQGEAVLLVTGSFNLPGACTSMMIASARRKVR